MWLGEELLKTIKDAWQEQDSSESYCHDLIRPHFLASLSWVQCAPLPQIVFFEDLVHHLNVSASPSEKGPYLISSSSALHRGNGG